MSRSKTSEPIDWRAWWASHRTRIYAAIAGIAAALIFLVPSVTYILSPSPACEQHAEHPNDNRSSLSFQSNQRSGTQLEYRAGQEHEPEACFLRHTAEELIAGFTGVLAGFTGGLAVFTALLWWTTYALWRSSEESERRLERAYIFAGPALNAGEIASPEIAGHLRGVFRAENFGKTPGFIKETYLRMTTVIPLPEEPVYPPGDEHTFYSDEVVRDGGVQRIARMQFDQNEDSLIFGYVKYADIFGAVHTSRFCLVLSAEALREDPPFIFHRQHGGPNWNTWD